MNKNTIKSKAKHQTKQFIRRWHRRFGLAVSLWLILLAVTGILLNHSDDLSLQKSYVDSHWIIKLYGIKAPQKVLCFQSDRDETSVCQIDDQIYQQSHWLVSAQKTLMGFYPLADFQVLVTQNDVFVYTSDWQLVEHFNLDNGLPGWINKVGLLTADIKKPNDTGSISSDKPKFSQVSLVFKIEEKNWQLDQDLNWQEIAVEKLAGKSIQYKMAAIATNNQTKQLQQAYLTRQITLLHFLQDLHSARIFSKVGTYFTDLVALLLIALTISGLVTWLKRNAKKT